MLSPTVRDLDSASAPVAAPAPLAVVTVGEARVAIHPRALRMGRSVGWVTVDGREYAFHPLEVRKRLTPTELEIAAMLVRGDKPDAIAAHRGGSEDTVKTHVRRAYAKVGASTANQLADQLFTTGELDTNSLFEGKPMFWLSGTLLEVVRAAEAGPERARRGELEISGVSYAVVESPAQYIRLTEQERRIGQRVVRGLQNKVIAHELGIATNTVATHLKAMFAKCGVKSRKELALVLRRMGIASQAPDSFGSVATA